VWQPGACPPLHCRAVSSSSGGDGKQAVAVLLSGSGNAWIALSTSLSWVHSCPLGQAGFSQHMHAAAVEADNSKYDGVAMRMMCGCKTAVLHEPAGWDTRQAWMHAYMLGKHAGASQLGPP
jgi:hypothetical protein